MKYRALLLGVYDSDLPVGENRPSIIRRYLTFDLVAQCKFIVYSTQPQILIAPRNKALDNFSIPRGEVWRPRTRCWPYQGSVICL